MSELDPTLKDFAKAGQLPHAEISAAKALIAETAGEVYATEVLVSDSSLELLLALTNLPDVPFVYESAVNFGGNYIIGGDTLVDDEVHILLTMLPQLVHWLTCERPDREVTNDAFAKRASKLVANGGYEPVAALLHKGFSSETTPEATRCFTPIALLGVAASALSIAISNELGTEEAKLGLAARTQLVADRADPILQQLCQQIATSEALAVNLPGDEALQNIVRGAMRALNTCYHIGDSNAEITSISAALLAVWIRAKLERIVGQRPQAASKPNVSPLGIPITMPAPIKPVVSPLGIAATPITKPVRLELAPLLATAKTRLIKEFARNGIVIDPSILDDVDKSKIHAAASGDLLQSVNRAYSKIRIHQITTRLVQAVAEGRMLYATLHLAGGLLGSNVLGIHAAEVKIRQAADLERQVQEELARRKADEEVMLREVTQLKELGWQPLRRSERKTREPGSQPARAPQPREAKGKRKPAVDGYRLAALEDIKHMFDGAEIYWRPDFKHRKKSPKPQAGKDEVQPTEDDDFVEYWVLVIPRKLDDGRIVYDAIAECAELDTAAYYWPAEWGMDAIGNILYDWKVVFDNDRPYATKLGAVPLYHPTKAEVKANPARAAGRFRNRLVGLLTKPFMGTVGANARFTRQQSNYRLIISDESKVEVDLTEEEAAKRRKRVVGGVLNVIAIERPAA